MARSVLTLYVQSGDPAIQAIAEKLEKLGYYVEMKEALDVTDPVLEGPFGRIRGLKEIMIVLRQLELSRS